MTLNNCPSCDAEAVTFFEEDFLEDGKTWTIKCGSWRCGIGYSVSASTREQAKSKWQALTETNESGEDDD